MRAWEPVRAGRNLGSARRDAGQKFNFTHAREIGDWSKIANPVALVADFLWGGLLRVVMSPVVASNEFYQRGRHIARLFGTAPAQLAGNVFGDVARPALDSRHSDGRASRLVRACVRGCSLRGMVIGRQSGRIHERDQAIRVCCKSFGPGRHVYEMLAGRTHHTIVSALRFVGWRLRDPMLDV